MEIQSIELIEQDFYQRLDKVILNHHENESRTSVQGWIKAGCVFVNDKNEKSSYKVQPGDYIRVEYPKPVNTDILPEDIPLDIVYEDKDVIVVNKPSGMIVHPSSGIYSGTLVNALLYHCHDLSAINGVTRPGIVHRIDKETSGLIVAAKNDLSHQSLSKQLEEHTVIRRYIALVHGEIPHTKGRIVAPIGRDQRDRQKMNVTSHNGKEAITNFTVLERFKNMTLVECRLETGRTHQIRVHMNYIGYPVYGDPKYGYRNDDISHGQYLHAKLLGFKHPVTGKELLFECKLPDWFENKLNELRG